MAPENSLKWRVSRPVSAASCALFTHIACALAAHPCPAPMIAVTLMLCLAVPSETPRYLKNGQLYGKALGIGFISMFVLSQCPGRAGQWICWPQEGTGGRIIETKGQILVDIKHEEHVNYVHQRPPPLTPPPRKRIRLAQSLPLGDLDPWLYRLLNSTHHLLKSTNPTLTEDCWLCHPPSLPQVLATPMHSFEASPGNKLDLPLTRPNITNVKLTHPTPQCLQSLQGSSPLRKISKHKFCQYHSQQITLTACPPMELILFVELLPMLAYFPVGRESVLRLS
jgi:hypothetical protein